MDHVTQTGCSVVISICSDLREVTRLHILMAGSLFPDDAATTAVVVQMLCFGG
jgi:hypothetical protein